MAIVYLSKTATTLSSVIKNLMVLLKKLEILLLIITRLNSGGRLKGRILIIYAFSPKALLKHPKEFMMVFQENCIATSLLVTYGKEILKIQTALHLTRLR